MRGPRQRLEASFTGGAFLDNLVLIYDANEVTLDAMAKETQSEDAEGRMRAIGFDVQTIDGHDMGAFLAAYENATSATSIHFIGRSRSVSETICDVPWRVAAMPLLMPETSDLRSENKVHTPPMSIAPTPR